MQPMRPKRPFGWVVPVGARVRRRNLRRGRNGRYRLQLRHFRAEIARSCRITPRSRIPDARSGIPARGPHPAIPIARHPNGLPRGPARATVESKLSPFRSRPLPTPRPPRVQSATTDLSPLTCRSAHEQDQPTLDQEAARRLAPTSKDTPQVRRPSARYRHRTLRRRTRRHAPGTRRHHLLADRGRPRKRVLPRTPGTPRPRRQDPQRRTAQRTQNRPQAPAPESSSRAATGGEVPP